MLSTTAAFLIFSSAVPPTGPSRTRTSRWQARMLTTPLRRRRQRRKFPRRKRLSSTTPSPEKYVQIHSLYTCLSVANLRLPHLFCLMPIHSPSSLGSTRTRRPAHCWNAPPAPMPVRRAPPPPAAAVLALPLLRPRRPTRPVPALVLPRTRRSSSG